MGGHLMRIFIIIISVVAVVIVGFLIFILGGMKQVKDLSIGNVDLSQVEDGTYTGEFKGYRWSNKVEVTVNNHQISGLKIVKDVRFPVGEVSKTLFERILQKQSLQVDTVTKATVNSKAYLKAVENALKGTGK